MGRPRIRRSDQLLPRQDKSIILTMMISGHLDLIGSNEQNVFAKSMKIDNPPRLFALQPKKGRFWKNT